MKRILVPTDFSEHSINALKVAAQLAKKYQSEIYLLHILEFPAHSIDQVSGGTSNVVPEVIFFMKSAHKRFEELLAQDFLKGLTVHETVNSNFDNAYAGIIESSKECNAEMIIIGSHGSQGIEELLVGSNTEKVVRNSDIPVMVIKHEHEVFSVDDFVYATAFKNEDIPSLKKANAFAKEIDAKLHLLYINTPNNFMTDDEIKKMTTTFITKAQLDNYETHTYNDRSVERGILNFSKNIGAGLIGISTHGRKGISHFFNGSLSEDLVNHAQRPVLTYKI